MLQLDIHRQLEDALSVNAMLEVLYDCPVKRPDPGREPPTSSHTSNTINALGSNAATQESPILSRLRCLFPDALTVSANQSREFDYTYLRAINRTLEQLYFGPHTLKTNESAINKEHETLLDAAISSAKLFFTVKAAESGLESEFVESLLEQYVLETKPTVSSAGKEYKARPDHALFHRKKELHVSPQEDKGTKALGIDGSVDLLSPTPSQGCKDVIAQVFTQIVLCYGNVGVVTGMEKGTWLVGATASQKEAEENPASRILYSSKNLTPSSLNLSDVIRAVLEADLLCILHAMCRVDEVLCGILGLNQTSLDLFAAETTFLIPCPLAMYFTHSVQYFWMALSLLALLFLGPTLLQKSWVAVYFWNDADIIRCLRPVDYPLGRSRSDTSFVTRLRN
ncbi:hypothetical protein HGRIS_005440 [Hohenbuehelia grisea]|uniref:Uncharacterized protein n=1 Tax=Hohenbuehelia grisea TaxID=104357 RepID=A0ABR3JYX6_9AGAR